MKHPLPYALAVMLLCANFGQQDNNSVAGANKPPVNFYGKLVDSTGASYKVENITVSHMYKQIPVYAKPNNPDVDPAINTTRLDLSEIKSISVPNKGELLPFNKRKYIAIKVTSKSGTENYYIINASKHLFCDQKDTAGPTEKELSFQAIDTLTIEGHKEPKPIHTPGDPSGMQTTKTTQTK